MGKFRAPAPGKTWVQSAPAPGSSSSSGSLEFTTEKKTVCRYCSDFHNSQHQLQEICDYYVVLGKRYVNLRQAKIG